MSIKLPSLVMNGQLLVGRTVMISGAGRARGIGKATARLLIQHGASVVMLDRDADEVRQAAIDVCVDGGVALGLSCDVTRMEDCVAAVDRALQWEASSGRIDVVINNAGVTQKRGVTEITHDDYLRITDVILRGTVQLSQAAIPTMRKQGSGNLIAISSMSAQQGGGIFGGAHYCAAKAGILGFTRALAKELGPDGIRANAIAPGLIVTDLSNSGRSDEDKHASGSDWPLGRAGMPDEIAGACLFLASDLSSFITGTTLDVNGGAYMR